MRDSDLWHCSFKSEWHIDWLSSRNTWHVIIDQSLTSSSSFPHFPLYLSIDSSVHPSFHSATLRQSFIHPCSHPMVNLLIDLFSSKAEDTIAMEKALSVLRDELHFPEERAISFLCRLKKQEAASACSPNSDQLNADNFNQFIRKITEMWVSRVLGSLGEALEGGSGLMVFLGWWFKMFYWNK